MMNVRNPTFTADGKIDCEIEHPTHGWLPFTANPNDVEQKGRDTYAVALYMGPAEYVAPPVLPPTEDEIRAQRNALLTASDWTQVADAPVDQTLWAVYRQELRDVPDQEGFPTNVIWPTQPE